VPETGDAPGAGRRNEGNGQVATAGEDRRGAQAPEQDEGLRRGGGQPERVEDEVDVAGRAPQGANGEPVIGQVELRGDELVLEAAGAADVAEVNVGTCVSHGPRDGQRGVHVPAGPAARHRTPHQAGILSGWSRG